MAKAEGGSVAFYTFGSDLVKVVSDGFRKSYPWASVSTFVGSAGDISNKVLSESITNVGGADVFMLPPTHRQSLLQNNVVTAASIPSESALPAGYRDPTGYGHPVYQALITLVYNTNLVKTPPNDLMELVDPAWDKKLAFDKPQNLALSTLWLAAKRKDWGEDKWNTWLKGLKANDALITDSGGDAYTAVVRGDRPLCVDGTNDVIAQPAGTPAAADYTDDAVVPLVQLAWLAKKSPHPNTGKLLLDWIVSEAGQTAIASTGRSPVLNLNVPSAIDKIMPRGTSPLPLSDLDDLFAHTDQYEQTFNKLWPA